MDSDGRNDLVFQSGDLDFTVIKQLSNGTLSMTPEVYTITSSAPSFDAFTVGDANSDGKNDVVVVTDNRLFLPFFKTQQGNWILLYRSTYCRLLQMK
jgi:hypothetical protein